MPTRYKWYAVVFVLVALLTVALLVGDFAANSPARTTVPMEDHPEYKKSPENEKPAAEEGGPYR